MGCLPPKPASKLILGSKFHWSGILPWLAWPLVCHDHHQRVVNEVQTIKLPEDNVAAELLHLRRLIKAEDLFLVLHSKCRNDESQQRLVTSKALPRPKDLPECHGMLHQQLAAHHDKQHPEGPKAIRGANLLQVCKKFGVALLYCVNDACHIRKHLLLVHKEFPTDPRHQRAEAHECLAVVLKQPQEGHQQIRHSLTVSDFRIVEGIGRKKSLHALLEDMPIFLGDRWDFCPMNI
mmetsp:Transcript_29486/g.83169  ORF Transcript_29486/g.83169 Transcript_29486/m.83169 type:complete len:235 (+) Transcript_29486:564-1268(+)